MNGIVRLKGYEVPFVQSILELLPQKYSDAFYEIPPSEREKITEIRIRSDSPCSFTVVNRNYPMKDKNGNIFSSNYGEIWEIISKLCEDSVYSYSQQIKEGYIPYKGTRIGVCGTGSCIDGEYVGQRKLTSISIRIPGYFPDAANSVLEYIRENGFDSSMGVLAISPPNYGKTTFLRALAAGLSDYSQKGFGKRVCIIDERGEMSSQKAFPSCFCDVISGIPKLQAVEMVTRTMSPQVIVFDEIGNEREAELLCSAFSGGVYIAASVHGNSLEDIAAKNGIYKAIGSGVFKTAYIMQKNASLENGEIIPLLNTKII